MNKILKCLSIISLVLFINCCATYQTETAKKINSKNYKGIETSIVISDIENKQFNCLRHKNLESDKRLKQLTDGTLEDVMFHVCTIESSSFFCVKRTSTMVVSQYNKVIKVNGMSKSKSCLWTY